MEINSYLVENDKIIVFVSYLVIIKYEKKYFIFNIYYCQTYKF